MVLGEILGLSLIGLFVVFGVIILVPLIILAFLYNLLISKRNRVENTFATVDVLLKKRYDLIPNLVSTVGGYAKHESETFRAVTEARASMANAKTVKEKAEANNILTGALKSLFAVAENYPQLKANENFMQLQEELTTTENKTSFARQFYNDSILRYDTKRQVFPSNLVANLFRFKDMDYFQVAEADKAVPKVKF